MMDEHPREELNSENEAPHVESFPVRKRREELDSENEDPHVESFPVRRRREELDSENEDPHVASFPVRKSCESSTTSGPKKGDGASVSSSQPRKKDKFQSFHDTILESMEETQRIRLSRLGMDGNSSNASVLIDTVKDIQSAASGTIATIKGWANQNNQQEDEPHILPPTPGEHAAEQQQDQAEKNTIIQDLAWPFAFCGFEVSKLPHDEEFAPHMKKMTESVSKLVRGDINAANDVWKFAAYSAEEDDHTVGTLDTLQEENNQLRRLGSWGTVGTTGTNGTCDTGFQSIEGPSTPMGMSIGIEDDDGNAIDPLLLEKTQKTREKRQRRRQKLVKFDYPPIKSLRQYPRHDPEDLPNLFFMEGELDQIEDDRYSTMSTDDIEIVIVADNAGEKKESSKSPRSDKGTTFADQPSPSSERDQPPEETPLKQSKGRPSTPFRHRRVEDDDPDFAPSEPASDKSPKNSRLVRGVQIYLRERSTGAA